ncbi:nitroreductase family deazaflavin-dependent oxidoreductase [Micromonospora peucetia]|uniref:nitroreductase/quinone reductase family protein n=1 Tax=Micromonospora peucetia TaxID=47871 RepID=UPI00225500C4|nr:nitroreductase/quinone reductase family protein [Micromonospora peucetia]MCX4390033.1 nitroreductase family deazaflavin-dependent oxidoreductase [Micromonospora peucetia]
MASPQHPNWYLNVVRNLEVRVQIRAEKFAAQARTALGEERTRLWRLMTSLVPIYHMYEARCRRVIPVVVLERM